MLHGRGTRGDRESTDENASLIPLALVTVAAIIVGMQAIKG